MNTQQILLATLLFCIVSSLDCDEQGRVLNDNSICITPKYIEGCFKYHSETQCFLCQPFYLRTQNSLCHLDEYLDEPCCLEKSGDRCAHCKAGLVKTNEGTCQFKKIIGCLEMNDEGQCLNCASNFALIEGRCEDGIDNCKTYQDMKTREFCTQCHDGYSLVNNACHQNYILGCFEEQDHKCNKCADPFHQVEDHCEIQNCASYNEYGCVSCECGFYLKKDGSCEKLAPGCIRYQRGVCTDCQPHFIMDAGKCIIKGCEEREDLECKKCEDGYNLSEGVCKIDKCLKEVDGVCVECENMFRIFMGKCLSVAVRPSFNEHLHGGLRKVASD